MYHWTEDMIRFMTDAAGYGDYHRKLAELILPELRGRNKVCDAGCGLGDLSLALSGEIEKITAVDIKPQAIRKLREKIAAGSIRGIEAVNADIRQMRPVPPYDGMIFCFFGRSEEILDIAGQQCRGTVIAIKKNYNTHRFSVGSYPSGPDGYTRMQAILMERKIPFRNQPVSLEFGQPFRCFEDIRKFYLCYSRDEDPAVLTDEFLRSRVIETGNPVFPFYMPHLRRLGIISFEAENIR